MKRPATWKFVTVGAALGLGVICTGVAMAEPTDAGRESTVTVDAGTAMATPTDALGPDILGGPDILRGPPEVLRGPDILRGPPEILRVPPIPR